MIVIDMCRHMFTEANTTATTCHANLRYCIEELHVTSFTTLCAKFNQNPSSRLATYVARHKDSSVVTLPNSECLHNYVYIALPHSICINITCAVKTIMRCTVPDKEQIEQLLHSIVTLYSAQTQCHNRQGNTSYNNIIISVAMIKLIRNEYWAGIA